MFEQLSAILEYVVDSFIHIWPYLLLTIPIAVAVKMSGASAYISRALSAKPLVAIILATIVGAFSPLCSCSVVPVVAALLIGGVPLAPIMSFWLASPSMDPEIFLLSVSTLGWDLAVWRLAATLLLSMSGGFVTHFFIQNGWLGKKILRETPVKQNKPILQTIRTGLREAYYYLVNLLSFPRFAKSGINTFDYPEFENATNEAFHIVPKDAVSSGKVFSETQVEGHQTSSCSIESGSTCSTEVEETPSFWSRLTNETWMATTMVIKFMILAWTIGALIHLYVPEEWITGVLGGNNPWAIFTAALLGIPVYTSNLTAMPLVGGLLSQGMHPAAGLAFLIAGPMTTLPAMSAVWGLVNRKVFALYIGFALFGAVIFGYIYKLS
jgi:hypothetical protein